MDASATCWSAMSSDGFGVSTASSIGGGGHGGATRGSVNDGKMKASRVETTWQDRSDEEEDPLARRIRFLLGDKQNEFSGTVSNTGPHYGLYGTFLPTQIRAQPPQSNPPPAPVIAADIRPKQLNACSTKPVKKLEVLSVPKELALGPENNSEGGPKSIERSTQVKAKGGEVKGGHLKVFMAANKGAPPVAKGALEKQKKNPKGGLAPENGLKPHETKQEMSHSFERSPSPQSILQTMTATFIPEGGLLSPLRESILSSLQCFKARLLSKSTEAPVETQPITKNTALSANARASEKDSGQREAPESFLVVSPPDDSGKLKDTRKAVARALLPFSRGGGAPESATAPHEGGKDPSVPQNTKRLKVVEENKTGKSSRDDKGVRSGGEDRGVRSIGEDKGVRSGGEDRGVRSIGEDKGVRSVGEDRGVRSSGEDKAVRSGVEDKGVRASGEGRLSDGVAKVSDGVPRVGAHVFSGGKKGKGNDSTVIKVKPDLQAVPKEKSLQSVPKERSVQAVPKGVNLEKGVISNKSKIVKDSAKPKIQGEVEKSVTLKSNGQEKKQIMDVGSENGFAINKNDQIPVEETGLLHTHIPLVPAAPVVDEWVGCDKCNLWRLLPPHIRVESLPEEWNCSMNDWTPELASCDIPQEQTTAAVFHLTGRPWPPPNPALDASAIPLENSIPPAPVEAIGVAPVLEPASVMTTTEGVGSKGLKKKLGKSSSKKNLQNVPPKSLSKIPAKADGGAGAPNSALLKQKSAVLKEKSKPKPISKPTPSPLRARSPSPSNVALVSSKHRLDERQNDTPSKRARPEGLKTVTPKGTSTESGLHLKKTPPPEEVFGHNSGKLGEVKEDASPTLVKARNGTTHNNVSSKNSMGNGGLESVLKQSQNNMGLKHRGDMTGTVPKISVKRSAEKGGESSSLPRDFEKEVGSGNLAKRPHSSSRGAEEGPSKKKSRSLSPSEDMSLQHSQTPVKDLTNKEASLLNTSKVHSSSSGEFVATGKGESTSETKQNRPVLPKDVSGSEPAREMDTSSEKLSAMPTQRDSLSQPLRSPETDPQQLPHREEADNHGTGTENNASLEPKAIDVKDTDGKKHAENKGGRRESRKASSSTSSGSSDCSSSPSESDTSGSECSRRRGTPAESTVSTSPSRSAHASQEARRNGRHSRGGQTTEGDRGRASRRSQSPKDGPRRPLSPDAVHQRKESRDRSNSKKRSGRPWEDPARPRDGQGGAFRPSGSVGEGGPSRSREGYPRSVSREALPRRYEDRSYDRSRSGRETDRHGTGKDERDNRGSHYRDPEHYERSRERESWPRDRDWERDGRDGRYDRKDGRGRDPYHTGRNEWENNRSGERDRDRERGRDRYDEPYSRDRNTKEERPPGPPGGREAVSNVPVRREETGNRATNPQEPPLLKEQGITEPEILPGPPEVPPRREELGLISQRPSPVDVQTGLHSNNVKRTGDLGTQSSIALPGPPSRDLPGPPVTIMASADENVGPTLVKVPPVQPPAVAVVPAGGQHSEGRSDAAAQARTLKRAADAMRELPQKTDGYMRAALKFMEAASWDVFSLFEYCAKEYERKNLVGAAAVAWKCAAVARTRALMTVRVPRKEVLCLSALLSLPSAQGSVRPAASNTSDVPTGSENPSGGGKLGTVQRAGGGGGEAQPAVHGQQGDSPSSSAASDVDNANMAQPAAGSGATGLGIVALGSVEGSVKAGQQDPGRKVVQSGGGSKATHSSSVGTSVGNRASQSDASRQTYHRHLKDGLDMYSILEVWNKAAQASAATSKEGCWSLETLSALSAVGANGGLDPPESVLLLAQKALVAFGRTDAAC